MSKVMFNYTTSVLESVSFDVSLFSKELEKAVRLLLPYEMESLREWLLNFIIEKPELQQCLFIVKK
jgi:DNA replication protein DnaD